MPATSKRQNLLACVFGDRALARPSHSPLPMGEAAPANAARVRVLQSELFLLSC